MWLFKAQHYGVPARLLDWTEGAVYALYFAINRGNQNPRMYMLNPHCLNELAQGSKLPDYEYPLSWGRHAMDQGSFVWAALKDIFGHYYLQNPPVALKTDGSWLASNLHLGHDIVEIIFVQVTGSGNDHFLRKVRSNEWGAFDDLPTGTDILGRVRIIVK